MGPYGRIRKGDLWEAFKRTYGLWESHSDRCRYPRICTRTRVFFESEIEPRRALSASARVRLIEGCALNLQRLYASTNLGEVQTNSAH